MKGFFSGSTLAQSKKPSPTIPLCGACGLYKGCKSPKMSFSGNGRRKILIVGDFPGKEEDLEGTHFVGRAGKFLKRTLRSLGGDPEEDYWYDNALICHLSKKQNEGNVEVSISDRIGYCRPNLIRTIEQLRPQVILLLGYEAVQSIIGSIWKEDVGILSRWTGFQIPCRKWNCWICPTYDPSYVLRTLESRKKDPVPNLWFRRHLESALQLSGRPYDVIPNEIKEVELVLDTDEAARILDKMVERGGVVAFDYETTMLKPDWFDAEILSCSVCWNGKKTIAFPWRGAAVPAMERLIRSSMPKIASNLKMEDRWSRMEFGKPVKNWAWCTMTAAHALDNRPGICGLKFQSFVLLGAESYDDHISKFLSSNNSNLRTNQILEQVNLHDLLLYNGLDSLLEYRVAEKQMVQFGISMKDWL